MNRVLQLFPIWALAFSAIAYLKPELFTGLKTLIVPLLTVIMLTMGLTLTPSDFLRIKDSKKAVLAGVVLQFTVMPAVAIFVSNVFQLDDTLLIGMVLVGAVAGGTASNVLCYLAKGDVALSITMTAISTLLGVALTPLLIELLVGQIVDIPTSSMVLSLFKIVLLPVAFGIVLNHFFKVTMSKITDVLPIFSMVSIVFIIAIIVALNANKLHSVGIIMLAAVIVHNGSGLLLGYLAGKALGFEPKVCKTIALEVGMQNSGLAVALAMKFFTPAAAIAGTIFSIWHNVSGSILASYWQRQSNSEKQQ
ncbi:bile acid:sodium symporter family protein (plasmid) [Pseudoalteromonas xiamenensis]|uniref:bile acid:sodium symporter family protein n=1 Tax=Pseudoalteromonas xiamenensis TaxID=882626 RepID=UPI0027E3BA29|nr:bile acid:sodium symporter family protein [Pseudoalteromonas xiamenensis]WMN61677.1 bile acid:sodium symporter family protein [Pseudoalteromonas xiamenensis]